ncbi:MAG: hypothetical protein ACJ75J_02590, partial [Cytophagaceae bacterium]
MLFRKFLILFMLITPVSIALAQEYYTIGPMLHFNIGDEKVRTSFGIEFAYWNYSNFPYSFDFGVDFQKYKTRIYTEMQTGAAATGVSAGPFMEFKKKSSVQVGLQSSVWLNYIIGVDLRGRWQKGQDYFAPGIYAKIPWEKGGSSG